MRRVYLDHNATTPLNPDALEEMLPYLRDTFGNPSSIHWFGQEARRAVDRARQQVADLIGVDPDEIVFTSGGTEADNHAIRGIAGRSAGGGGHIVTSSVEHHAVLNTCRHLERNGFRVTYLPVDENGLVDPAVAESAITKDTILVTVMLANNDVGTIQPVRDIARIAGERGVPVHTDAVQVIGKMPVDARGPGVDLMSLSSHKICGPKGVGALYIRRGIAIDPLIFGGHHEMRRRAGTENVPAIVGFGKACEIAGEELERVPPKIAALRDRLQQGIEERIENVQLNGHPDLRLPNTLNVSFSFVDGESLLMNLDLMGVAVSTGSACTSGSVDPSHVLTAMGRNPEQAQGSLRFSLGRGNTAEDVDFTLDALVDVVRRLREISPAYKEAEAEKPERNEADRPIRTAP